MLHSSIFFYHIFTVICHIFILRLIFSLRIRVRAGMMLCGEDMPLLARGGVQINNVNVIPWREKHPQVCLHLAYILSVTDFPTPGFSPAPVLQDLTISSSWGSRNSAAAVQQQRKWDFSL